MKNHTASMKCGIDTEPKTKINKPFYATGINSLMTFKHHLNIHDKFFRHFPLMIDIEKPNTNKAFEKAVKFTYKKVVEREAFTVQLNDVL